MKLESNEIIVLRFRSLTSRAVKEAEKSLYQKDLLKRIYIHNDFGLTAEGHKALMTLAGCEE